MPNIFQTSYLGAIILIAVMALFSVTSAAGQTQTYIGNVVTLSGYSYSGEYVYLFLTGPNLPPDGVALDNGNRPGATRVDVDADGHWIYQWYTGATGGRLDAGSYTVWVTDSPTDRSHVSSVNYNTISVSLSIPDLTAGTSGGSGPTSEQPMAGSMNINATPAGTSVVVNNVYKGMTPLNLSGLNPGIYNVTLSHFGYARLPVQVTVQPGSMSEVNVNLVALTGSLFVNTTPTGAQLTLDGNTAGFSPATFQNITQGNHLLNATKKGFITQDLQVHIIADQVTTVDVTLLPSSVSGTWLSGFLPATAGAGILVVLFFMRTRSKK